MTKEEHTVLLEGYQLHRLHIHPDGKPTASLVFFHGQGDYIDRYPEYLAPLTEAGVSIIMTDLPGHGRSPGKRGAVPSLSFIDALLEDSLSPLPTDAPIGISGHSAGGLLALRSYLKNPKTFSFAWFSSPLLDPAQRTSPFLRTLLIALSRIAPWIGWSTGVKSSDCRTDSEPAPTDSPALYHSRITLGWASELIKAASSVNEGFLSLSRHIPTLFTQGDQDTICPPDILRALIQKLPDSRIQYQEIPGALHEPFNGDSSEEFQTALQRWIKEELFPDQ